MPGRMFAITPFVAGLMSVIGAGCTSVPLEPESREQAELAACSSSVQNEISLRVSASPRDVPKEFVVSEGVTKSYAILGRRLLIAVVPHDSALQLKIKDSHLSVTPFGGTFEGWAAFSRSDAGVDIAPGRIRVEPFFALDLFRPQTSTLDVVIRAGGAPFDQSAVTTTAMWDSAQQPVSADALRVALIPLRHFTAYDTVSAKFTVDFVAQIKRKEQPCQGTLETEVPLVEREAARPPLWDLGTSHKGGGRKRWLALLDPSTGPVRAIFTDPVAARGFALWIQQTGATHAGHYQLGVFDSEDLEGRVATVPTDSAIMESYRPITSEDRAELKVGPLAEP